MDAFERELTRRSRLAAMELRSGLAIAMSDSPDGLTNDVPLVPQLMARLHEVVERPMLSIRDRQFDDVRAMRHLCGREADRFVVRNCRPGRTTPGATGRARGGATSRRCAGARAS